MFIFKIFIFKNINFDFGCTFIKYSLRVLLNTYGVEVIPYDFEYSCNNDESGKLRIDVS
jgi:hypothetical protein